MNSGYCINGHEIEAEFRFCVMCGAERPNAMEEKTSVATPEHLVITIDESDPLATAETVKSSIGYLEPVTDVSPQVTSQSNYERRMQLDKARDEAYAEVSALENLQQNVAEWEQRNNHSFLAKTSAVMQKNIAEADGLLTQYNRTVDSLRIPEAGTMAKLRKSFHRKLLWQTILIPLLSYLIYKIPRIPNRNVQRFFDGVQPSMKVILIYATVIYLVLLLGALIAYYRGWSTYQRKVITTLWQLQIVSRNVDQVRSEQGRLKSLYPQVNEWLVILGHSLTNPWRIRKEWFESSIGDLNEASLPNSLRISQAHEDDGPAMMGMQRYAAERFMSRGWRAKVFADQIDVIRESIGLPKDRLNVDMLDQDILYSPNGPRALIRTNIEELPILESIGRRQLLPLIKEVQKEAITKSRPPVNEIRKATIKTQKVAAEDEENSELTPWDEFLGFSIPVQGKPRTPLSVFSLSDSGKVAAHHDRYTTFMIVPERFKEKVYGVDDNQLHTYGETTKLPMDVVVRADFTGPIPAQDLLFLEKTAAQRAAAEEKESKPKSEFKKDKGI
ncbi:unannotated protein [freshwater metagenome]|uniref:Unannotated protein n=1 Tax=freshwater metagenome TaxID=449393 RepID=A0A6J6FYY0_9ZZZZ|nr:hypothetical protein [Actinomycetota bacterium]